MYSPKSEGKLKGLISKILERFKYFGDSTGKKGSLGTTRHALKTKSESRPCCFPMETLDNQDKERGKRSKKVTPEGCFSVYVGPEKEKFVIKTEYVNHPLFKILLEEAESEYGYHNKGPLMLPCEVDHFVDVMMEIDYCDEGFGKQKGCNFVARSPSSYHFLTPPRVLTLIG